MTSLYKRGQFTGAILVAQQGRIVYQKAFGLADRERNKPFTIGTAEYIGSVSKPLTALGVMLLQERGRLTYDQGIRQFFPELPACMQAVTIRHLLQHTSGLATFDDFPDMTEKDVFAILLRQKELHFTPGEQFEYCNAGYSLLGMLIEKVSGQSLNAFLTANVFRPLAMTGSSVNEINNRNTTRAIGYDLYGTRNNYDTFMGGNASIISTVGDLYQWDQALYNSQFIKPETLQEAFKPSSIRLKDEVFGRKSYGFGWWVVEGQGGKTVFHDGAFGGYCTYLERSLKDQTTIIQLSNLRHPYVYAIRSAITNILTNQDYTVPKIAISSWLYQAMQTKGIDRAIKSYHRLRASADSVSYRFDESELNQLGYYLLRRKKVDESIRIFQLNTKVYPLSANVYDSLGEAYALAGQTRLAIESYQQALRLNPHNDHAVNMIKQLQDSR